MLGKSKKTPTYHWNIPQDFVGNKGFVVLYPRLQTLNRLFIKELLSYLYFGVPGTWGMFQGFVGNFFEEDLVFLSKNVSMAMCTNLALLLPAMILEWL